MKEWTVRVAGALGCEEAMWLQWLQLFLSIVMAGVIPRQNMDASAFPVIKIFLCGQHGVWTSRLV